MGLKLSCFHRGSLSRQVSLLSPAPASRAIFPDDGSLKEVPAASHPASVSDLLGAGGDASSFFVCSSDALYFNESPPALAAPGHLLRWGQICFVLPGAMLGRPLSSADMGGLAVRASAALASSSIRPRRDGSKKNNKKKKVRVMPVSVDAAEDDVFDVFHEKLNEQTLGQFGVLLTSPARLYRSEQCNQI